VIAVELGKLLRRPRTWITIALLCLLPTIVAIFLAVTDVAPRPGEGPAFLSAVLANGALFPAAALGIVLPLFLPVAVAVVAGDSVAGEASTGTLRYLLVRPVGRTRLLIAKLASVMAFLLIAVTAVAVTAYVVGTRLFVPEPGSPATVVTGLSGSTLTKEQLAVRTVLVILYIAWSMLGVAAVALFLSTDTLLAGLGRLLPGPDLVAGHRTRRAGARRLCRRASRDGLGELHDARRRRMTPPRRTVEASGLR
jgi:ABC-2 type transport system permease protein